MCWTTECTHICPESPLSSAAMEADSLLGMDPSVVVVSDGGGGGVYSSIFPWLLNCNYDDYDTHTHTHVITIAGALEQALDLVLYCKNAKYLEESTIKNILGPLLY